MAKEDLKTLAGDPAMKKRRQAAADPTRMRIIGLLGESEGMTAKELGQRLHMEPNRLYWHLRILEEAGLIEVAELRAAGRNTERVYKQGFDGRWAWDAQDPIELAHYMAAQLEVTKIEGEQALFEQAESLKQGEEAPVITWGRPTITTTHKEIKEFTKRLNDLMAEFRARAKAISHQKKGSPLNKLRFTWVVCEQAAPEPISQEEGV